MNYDFQNKTLVGKRVEINKNSRFVPVGSRFIDCDFEVGRGMNIGFGAGDSKTIYERCNFRNASFSSRVPGFSRFDSCLFENVNMTNFYSVSSDFINCIFTGRISNSFFNGSFDDFNDFDGEILGRNNNEIRFNDFRGTVFDDVAFRLGVDLSEQTFNQNSSSILINDGAKLIASLNKSENLDETSKDVIIGMIEFDMSESQTEVFLCETSFTQNEWSVLRRIESI